MKPVIGPAALMLYRAAKAAVEVGDFAKAQALTEHMLPGDAKLIRDMIACRAGAEERN